MGPASERASFSPSSALALAVAYFSLAKAAHCCSSSACRAPFSFAPVKAPAVSFDEAAASAKETTAAFTGGKQKGARQAELEQQWAGFAKQHYAQAQAKAEEALKLAK